MDRLAWQLMKQNYKKIGVGMLVLLGVWMGYNYMNSKQVQKEIGRAVGENKIEFVNRPEMIRAENDLVVHWKVGTVGEREITETTIYWDSESTAAAVTKKDAPDALGYRHKTNDYVRGEYRVPAEFEARIGAGGDKQEIYMRAYALIDDQHYWTEEQKVVLIP